MMGRHPASGYVQGINDLVTPFLMVFLQVHKIFIFRTTLTKSSFFFRTKDFVEEDVTRVSFEFSDLEASVRENIEADSFWCMTKVFYLHELISYGGIIIYEMICAIPYFLTQVLDGIQDNYTFAQPGIQTKIRCAFFDSLQLQCIALFSKSGN